MPEMSHPALRAEVTRNGFVESVHWAHAVIVGPDGTVEQGWGATDAAIFPRSCNKPLQAVGMVRAGLGLRGPDLALVAASHNGERAHVDRVRAILEAAGMSESDRQNTLGLPYGEAARNEYLSSGGRPSRITQNCSGKHSGMLLTCRALAAGTKSYLEFDHPVQRAGLESIEELSGERVTAHGIDGCGAPVVALSLVGLARAFARLVGGAPGSAESLVATAMSSDPFFVGGTGRDVTTFMVGLPGAVAKDGAEAVHAAALPDGRAMAVKVLDGSERARPAFAAAVLEIMGVQRAILDQIQGDPILGGGHPVGRVTVQSAS
jgi:L-asparaginase II